MTRAEVLTLAAEILDGFAERYYDDLDREAVARWKATQLAEIEQRMLATERALMH